jgi:group I intron endonuclease
MKEPVIYKIRNVVNGKFYVGSTTDTRERFRNHRKMLRGNKHHCRHLQASWNKHGEDCFKFEVQEVIEDAARLWEAEERWLAEHFGKDYCYNSGRAPEAPMRGRFGPLHPSYGKPVPQEQKAAISATLKAFYAEDPNNHPRVGKQHTDEAKAKISAKVNAAVAEGRGGAFIPSEETRQKMSEALKGNQNALGYKRTDAEREAIRQRTLGNQNFLGKKHTEEAKEKMRKKVLEQTSGQMFDSLTAVLTHYQMTMPTLRRALVAGKPITRGKFVGLVFVYA